MLRISRLKRHVVIPLVILLYLSAPLSWPAYTSCLLVTSLLTSGLAHAAFRRYPTPRASRPPL